MRKKINILGSGLMGAQIANLFCVMGYEVNIWNRSKINANDLLKQKKFFLKILKVDDQGGSINFIKELDSLKNNVTLETLVEDLEVKKDVFKKIETKC